MKRFVVLPLGIAAAILVVLGACAYFGAFNVAADAPHWGLTSRALALARSRAIAVRAADVAVPDLADIDLIAIGARHYSAMCSGCHLAPGVTNSELRQGLYPAPPDFTARPSPRPAESFWVIKHGIKMSAMPAWGSTHGDETIWAIVAFLQQLPTLDAKGYSALTGPSDSANHHFGADDHDHNHHAGSHDEAANRAAVAPGGTTMDQRPAVEHVHPRAGGKEHRAAAGGVRPGA